MQNRNVEIETDTQLLGTVFGLQIWDWRADAIHTLIQPHLLEAKRGIGTESQRSREYLEQMEWHLRLQTAKVYDAFLGVCA